jgi:predicted Rossmann-fold nucleotide-binding protein
VTTLVQTKKIDRVPIILMGSDYWSGLIDWIKKTMLDENKNINAEDVNLFHITDDPKEAIKIINEMYQHEILRPNLRMK